MEFFHHVRLVKIAALLCQFKDAQLLVMRHFVQRVLKADDLFERFGADTVDCSEGTAHIAFGITGFLRNFADGNLTVCFINALADIVFDGCFAVLHAAERLTLDSIV